MIVCKFNDDHAGLDESNGSPLTPTSSQVVHVSHESRSDLGGV
jgi:hypothetical protein